MRSVVVAAFASLALACQTDTFGTDAGDDGSSGDAPASDALDANPQPCAFIPFDGGDKCGQDKCNAGDDCCVTSSQLSCESAGNCTGSNAFALSCRKPLDCATVTADGGLGQVCCLTHGTEAVGCPMQVAGPGASTCVLITKCNSPAQRLCAFDVDCPVGQHCSRAVLAGDTAAVVGVCF